MAEPRSYLQLAEIELHSLHQIVTRLHRRGLTHPNCARTQAEIRLAGSSLVGLAAGFAGYAALTDQERN